MQRHVASPRRTKRLQSARHLSKRANYHALVKEGGQILPVMNCQLSKQSESAHVTEYLIKVLGRMGPLPLRANGSGGLGDAMDAAFKVITGKDFCYLSKRRSEVYRSDFGSRLGPYFERGIPLRFHYDIGGGYHASIDAGRTLGFDVGLAELMVLSQISRFDQKIREVYRPGTRFSLVIDNLCALLVNDIPLAETQRYVAQLRCLIERVEMGQTVDVLVESENFSEDDYRRNAPDTEPVDSVSAKDLENVGRFLGRDCSIDEARERMSRYRSVTQISEERLSSIIDGFHMTQRATPTTFGFRAYPGGDSRIQAGRVGLIHTEESHLRPVLITSRNHFDVIRAVDTLTPVSDLIGPVLLASDTSV